jgi:hypothetical protein
MGWRPLARQLVIRRFKWPDVAQPQAFKRPRDTGRWSRLRSRVCGTDDSGLETSDNPQTTPKRDDFRLR